MVLESIYNFLFGTKKQEDPRESLYKFESQTGEERLETYAKSAVDILKTIGSALTLVSPPTTVAGLVGLGAKSKVLDIVEKATFDNSFKYYGNWGGPNYSSGRNFKRGENLSKKDLDIKPIDGLDNLYKTHDLEYVVALAQIDPEKRKQMLRDADNKFVMDAEKYLSSDEATMKEKLYGYPSVKAFQVKIFSDVGYDQEQINNPDITQEVEKILRLDLRSGDVPLSRTGNQTGSSMWDLTSPPDQRAGRGKNTIEIPYYSTPEFAQELYNILFDDDEDY